MVALEAFRDDGPVASALGRVGAGVALPPLATTAVGVVALAAGLAVDRTGVPAVIGAVVFVLLGGVVARRSPSVRTAWLIPPLLHAGGYGAVVALAAPVGGAALPAAFAVLAATAYHHYDSDNRLRLRGAGPPGWVALAGLGWDGRVLTLAVATAAGVFTPVAVSLAIWCGAVFVGESIRTPVAAARK